MANKLLPALTTWPAYAIVAVLLTVGGVIQLVSRPHGINLFLGVLFGFLGLSNAINAVRAYRRRVTERGRSVGGA